MSETTARYSSVKTLATYKLKFVSKTTFSMRFVFAPNHVAGKGEVLDDYALRGWEGARRWYVRTTEGIEREQSFSFTINQINRQRTEVFMPTSWTILFYWTSRSRFEFIWICLLHTLRGQGVTMISQRKCVLHDFVFSGSTHWVMPENTKRDLCTQKYTFVCSQVTFCAYTMSFCRRLGVVRGRKYVYINHSNADLLGCGTNSFDVLRNVCGELPWSGCDVRVSEGSPRHRVWLITRPVDLQYSKRRRSVEWNIKRHNQKNPCKMPETLPEP